MRKVMNGLKATAMDLHIRNLFEDIEDEDTADEVLSSWLTYGVPDGNDWGDNVMDFGDHEDFIELHKEYMNICDYYGLDHSYGKELKTIFENLAKTVDKFNQI